MGKTTKIENDHTRVNYNERARKMLNHYYEIAEEMTLRARDMVKSGEDIRSNEERPGVATLMHAGAAAISEIVRLSPIAGVNYEKVDIYQDTVGQSIGWNYDPEKEAELLALIPKDDPV